MTLQVPPCVTVRLCPAIVSVPIRAVVTVLGSTSYVTVPLPVPLLPLVIVIQDVALLHADHVQPLLVVTDAVSLRRRRQHPATLVRA